MNKLPAMIAIVFAARGALAQWQPDVRLTDDVAFSSTTLNNGRSLVAGGGALHAVWFDSRDGNLEVYYKRSPDGGGRWSPDTRLTSNAAPSMFPAIAISGNAVHVVWEEYRDGNAEIYYKRSLDAGLSWGPDTRLTTSAAHSFSPSISISGTTVHVAWFDARDGNHEVYYKRSVDVGGSWSPDARLTVSGCDSIFASIASVGGAVFVAWEEYRDGPNGEIYFKRSSDEGATWEPDQRLTTNSANSFSPSIAASGARVHVAWFDQRDGNLEIYEKHSTSGGVDWTADFRLTSSPGHSHYPSIAAAGANVHVAWIDERDGNLEIYYKRSTSGGAAWEPDLRLTNDPFRSTDATVVPAGEAAHVLWTDARDGSPNGSYNGNYEIYYKFSPDGNVMIADFDGNGHVGPADLAQLLASWGQCSACAADLDGDETVGPADLAQLLARWG
jgi:hypothetical protein